MAALDPVPMPPELAEPEPGAGAWLEQVVAYAVELAADAGMDAQEAGAMLAGDTATGQADNDTRLPEPAKRWTVTDTGGAEWAMRHVAAADAELATLAAQANEWAGRISAWFTHAAKQPLATKGLMEAHLLRYALQLREANPKRKTLTLPAGKVQTSYTAAKVEIADDDAVVAWAESVGLTDDVVRTKKEPKVSLLREHVSIGPWWVGVRVTLVCGHTDLMADSAYPPPEPGEAYHCPQCPNGDDAYHGGPSHVESVAVQTVIAAVLYPEAPPAPGLPGTLRRVPGTYVADEKVTAKVQAERP